MTKTKFLAKGIGQLASNPWSLCTKNHEIGDVADKALQDDRTHKKYISL